MMGVTKGGILVPQPLGYDWELFNNGMQVVRPVTFLTCSAASTPKIVTRVPHNAAIDDFDYFYAVQGRVGATANYTISVKNLRTSLVVATAAVSEASSPWVARRFALAKTNPILPGDFIEITLTWASGGTLQVRTYQKDIFFASGTQVGQAFPYAQDAVGDRFQAPAVFFTWQDADANVITEWMPGLLPMMNRQLPTLPGTEFVGNLLTMPFTDRRPSGIWLYAGGIGAKTARIYAEPTSPTDMTELYSLAVTLTSPSAKMSYIPFDGGQPRLEQGKKYIVGFDYPIGVYCHQWIRQVSGIPPFWTVAPVHLGFDELVNAAWRISGSWTYAPGSGYVDFRGEFGLVFEESET